MNTIQTENLIGPDKVMDVRPIPCSVKHGLIIRTWLELPVDDHFILLRMITIPCHSTTSSRLNGRGRSPGAPGERSR